MGNDYVSLAMDDSNPLGNTQDTFGKRALHTIIGNSASESIPVYVTNAPAPPESTVSIENEISSVPNGATTPILSYTVPVSSTLYLSLIEVGGSNIATYDILIDSVRVARKRTYFGNLNENFNFQPPDKSGLQINAGQVLEIDVTHFRPDVGDFEARIIGAVST